MQRSIDETVKHIQHGGVIAYPTEAVWGLGCDPFSRTAVHEILELKKRPVEKGLILVFASVQQVAQWITLSSDQYRLLSTPRPRATTFIVPCGDLIPTWIKGHHDTVAIRISTHPTVVALCEALGHGIVSTSANPAGKPEAQTASEVTAYFGDHLLCCEGRLGEDPRPSQIIDIITGRLIRA